MARITNSSEQLELSLELDRATKTVNDWGSGTVAVSRLLENGREFQQMFEGIFEIFEDDLSRLSRDMRDFLASTGNAKNFRFIPTAEPSFEISLERIQHGPDYCRVVSVSLDLKTFACVRIPTAYGEDRISARFHTTEEKIQQFGLDFLKEAEVVLSARQ